MLLKQLTTYQIEMPTTATDQPIALVPTEWRDHIEQSAQSMRIRPLTALQQTGSGFEPPLHKINSEYVVAADSCGLLLLCYRIDTKAINAAGIKESVEAKAKIIEHEEGRRVRKLEREAIHDDFVTKALPHIQPTPKRILILLDLRRYRVLIGTKSEDLATTLRRLLAEHIVPGYEVETADEKEVRRPRFIVDSNCKGDPREHYRQWMIQGVQGLQLHDGAYLEKEASKNIIVTGQANDAQVITDALDDGYQPFQVSVSVMNTEADSVIADVVLDRFGQYTAIRIPGHLEIIKSTHEDEKEAAMADLHANMVLTAGTAHDVEHAVKVAFGDQLEIQDILKKALDMQRTATIGTSLISKVMATACLNMPTDSTQTMTYKVGQGSEPIAAHPEVITVNAPAIESEADYSIYPAARSFVMENQKCSISTLQRHLRIGYNYAARIVEKLEFEGVVSKPSNNGTRKVLISELSSN
jgi:DNA recombination-dependent growth factor C